MFSRLRQAIAGCVSSLTLGCNDVHMTYWINGEVQEKLDSIDVTGEDCDVQLPGMFDLYHMSHKVRKPVFRFSDQVQQSYINRPVQSQKKDRSLKLRI